MLTPRIIFQISFSINSTIDGCFHSRLRKGLTKIRILRILEDWFKSEVEVVHMDCQVVL